MSYEEYYLFTFALLLISVFIVISFVLFLDKLEEKRNTKER